MFDFWPKRITLPLKLAKLKRDSNPQNQCL